MATNEELIQEMQRFNALSRRNGQGKGKGQGQHRYGKLANGGCEHDEESHGEGAAAEHDHEHGQGGGKGKGKGKGGQSGRGQGGGMGRGQGGGRGTGQGEEHSHDHDHSHDHAEGESHGEGKGEGRGRKFGQNKKSGMGRGINRGKRGMQRGAGQNRVLAALKNKDGITQKDLAQELSIRPQTLSESLVKLESENLVQREQDTQDKRITHVYLTEEGKTEADSALEDQKSNADDIFNVLTEEERHQFSTILAKLNAQMEASNAEPADGNNAQ